MGRLSSLFEEKLTIYVDTLIKFGCNNQRKSLISLYLKEIRLSYCLTIFRKRRIV